MPQTAEALGGIAFGTLRAEMLAQQPRLAAQDFAPHVPTAIAASGRIKPEYAEWLTRFMVESQADGIDLAALRVQRQKPQLNRAEKRRIGIRSEMPFSRLAFDMLTEAGCATPLDALRATAMLVAARRAASAAEWQQREIGVTHYIWTTRGDAQVCPACTLNTGRIFAWDAPPPGGHPGMRSCCADGHCRCVAQAVMAAPELVADGGGGGGPAADRGRTADEPRRFGFAAVTILALLVLACLSLLPLLLHWVSSKA